jgi:hypothetical protein
VPCRAAACHAKVIMEKELQELNTLAAKRGGGKKQD